MRCDQFRRRINSLLDERKNVDRDALLVDHARRCDSCRDDLLAWSAIDELVSPNDAMSADGHRLPNQTPLVLPTWTAGRLATAAAILVCFGVTARVLLMAPAEKPNVALLETGTSAQQPQKTPGPLPQTPTLTWQSSEWWNAMSDEPWVNHTLPAVNSVRKGVAPIGRSMKQAFAILMIQSHPTTINAASVTPDIQLKPIDEQSSTVDPSIDVASWA